jgi:hypothetical protein
MNCIPIILAALESDPTATPEERRRILAALRPTQAGRVKTITTAAAAEILDTHICTVRRWGKQGLLTPIRISSRKIRWRLDEVERLASSGASGVCESRQPEQPAR